MMRTLALCTILAASVAAAEAEEVSAVATFSVLGDMVKQVGGERVTVTDLVGPDGDPHVYQPTPQDARAIRQADVLVMNGLEFEGWIERLIEASGYDGPVVVATRHVDARPYEADAHGHGEAHAAHDEEHGHGEAHAAHGEEHGHGEAHAAHGEEHGHGEAHAAHGGEHGHGEAHAAHGDGHDHGEAHAAHGEEHGHGEAHAAHDHEHGVYDPHAWLSLTAAQQYVRAIAEGLSEVDPDGAEAYAANAERYMAEIDALETELENAIAALPPERRTVVIAHDAFGYFEDAYGIRFLSPQGISTESEPSARDVARLIRQIRQEGIDAVFLETITDNRLVQRIAEETDATIGGELYSGALSGPGGPATTYLDMMRHNIRALTGALGA